MKKNTLLAALLITVAAAPANAAITVYTSQQAFLNAVGAVGVDTFENFNINGSTPSPITRSAGAFGYTAAASTSSFFGAGSTADSWLSTNIATDSITFSAFTGGVSALGGLFFASDIGGQFIPGSVTVSATDSSGTVSRTIVGANTTTFLGFVSTGPLLSATLASVQPGTGFAWPTANNLTLGNASVVAAVPEPATWAMMLFGFGAMGSAMRRRKANVRTAVTYA